MATSAVASAVSPPSRPMNFFLRTTPPKGSVEIAPRYRKRCRLWLQETEADMKLTPADRDRQLRRASKVPARALPARPEPFRAPPESPFAHHPDKIDSGGHVHRV